MAKLGKIVAVAALLGAAGAGAYYYYKSKEEEFDDFDEFEDDFEDDFEEEFEDEKEPVADTESKEIEESAKTNKTVKEYVPLKISKEDVLDAKETIQKAAKEVSEQTVTKYEFEKLTEE